jgi:hypothetical protein
MNQCLPDARKVLSYIPSPTKYVCFQDKFDHSGSLSFS